MVDSRTTLRFPIDLLARLEIGGAQLAARIRNISLGGVYLLGPTLTIGTRVRLQTRTPRVTLDVRCVTRWTTTDGCGLQFDALQPMDSEQLAHLLQTCRRPSGRLPTDAILRRPAR